MTTSRTQRDVIVTVVALVLVVVVINLVARGLDSAVGGSEPGGATGLVLRDQRRRARRRTRSCSPTTAIRCNGSAATSGAACSTRAPC